MIIKSSFSTLVEYTSIREGELKLGEVISIKNSDIDSIEDLEILMKNITALYVIVGISEDIGIRANYGKPGARNAYENFLSYFVNIQKNQFVADEKVYILGELFVQDVLELSDINEDTNYLRGLTAEIDKRVSPIIEVIIKSGKKPIIIGGGHNNSYGNIKGTSIALGNPIDVLNIDPHADFRVEEGRHSGNGFRYAYNQNYINQYHVWGLHENYNNQAILDAFHADENLSFQSFENIVNGKAVSFVDFISKLDTKIGLEIDLDSVKDMPTSAMTPVGFSEEEILNFLNICSQNKEILYYHFCEASPDKNKLYKTGKFLSYMVSSILK
jgi:formiminoglutamase